MQKAEMRGVDVALQSLQPVALTLTEYRVDLILREEYRLQGRQRRWLGSRSHIDPDQTIALNRLVGLGLDLVLVIVLRWHVRHVDAIRVPPAGGRFAE